MDQYVDNNETQHYHAKWKGYEKPDWQQAKNLSWNILAL